MDNKRRDLFEELRDRVKCMYISDLQYMPWKKAAQSEMEGMDLQPYSTLALSDAAQYLYGEKMTFDSIDEAGKYFKEKQQKAIQFWGYRRRGRD